MKRLKAAMQPVSFCISLTHVGDGGDLVRVGLDTSRADDVAQEYTGWNSKDAL